ncbi:MAG: hypothetical protein HXX13_11885 [Bacteroidetes bacterium]|nr:hypothetical protein [Bacteroidota bacterium]
MKKIPLSGLLIFLLYFSTSMVHGQAAKAPVPVSPFAKGSYWFNASDNFWFDQDNMKTDGSKSGKENSYGLDLSCLYFPVNHFGVGLSLSSSRDHSDGNSTTTLNSFNMLNLQAMYGNTFGKNFNLYFLASVGFGKEKSKQTSGSYTAYDDKYNDMSTYLELGSPIALGSGSGLYFTPALGYEFHQTKNSTYTDKSMGPYLGTSFKVSLPCSSYAHSCSEAKGFSDGLYSSGSSFFGGNTSISLRTGNDNQTKPDGENSSSTFKYSYSEVMFDLQYYHYILNDIAVGAGISFDNYSHNAKDNSTKYHYNYINFSPQVLANIPVEGALHNTFGFLEAGVGASSDKYESQGGSSTTYKYSLSDVTFGLGYNMFFARNFSLSPFIEYRWNTSKDKSSKIKTQANGFEAGFNIRHFYHY